jgi:S1-C subfamily serine protease
MSHGRLENDKVFLTLAAGSSAAAEAFRKEAHLASAPTATDGSVCKVAPKPGETLILESTTEGIGCTYKDLSTVKSTHPHAAQVLEKAKQQTVDVHASLSEGGSGTGVIAGRDGRNKTFVLVDRHVVLGTADYIEHMEDLIEQQDGKRTKFRPAIDTRFPNGKSYQAELVAEDPKTDLALLSVKTGADTDAIYHPAKFTTMRHPIKPGEPVYTAGFPDASSSLYFSLGTNKRDVSLKSIKDQTTILTDEQQDRIMHEHKLPVRRGVSGAGIYSDNAIVISLQSRISTDETRTFSTPVTQSIVDKLIEQARRNAK